ncbi:MAG: Gfo/Idh/MocA family oxidoreductase [Candidatus Hydrogenedentota bacterium]
MSRKQVSRRDFMKKTAGITAATAAATQTAQASVIKNIMPASVMGANERIITGHIGLGGMGKRDLQLALNTKVIQPIHTCDLISRFAEQGADMTQGMGGYARPKTTTRFEEVIENKDIDAIVIVTPDHWHTIPTIMACEAGKDVWTEKPLTTTIAEGPPVIKAVRDNKTVFQCGNFQRSGQHFQDVVQMVQEGYIGKVGRVETWYHDRVLKPLAPGKTSPAPPFWDRYLGWTPKVPYNSNRFIYNFRWYLNYSGGKMTDWGAHLIDIALWAMGEDNPPREVTSFSGNYVIDDERTTPDTLEALYKFDNYILSFSNRVWNGVTDGNYYGIRFHGDKGTIVVDRTGYKVTASNSDIKEKEVTNVKEGTMNAAHWQNWIDCIKSRKDPICFVESAFNTAKVCHMGTSAYVSGGRLGWDDENLKFTGTDEAAVKKANDWAHRPYQNGYSLEPGKYLPA